MTDTRISHLSIFVLLGASDSCRRRPGPNLFRAIQLRKQEQRFNAAHLFRDCGARARR